MVRSESRNAWDSLLLFTLVAVAGWCASATAASADQQRQEGRIVGLSAAGDVDALPAAEAEEAAQPQYWLGIHSAPIDSPLLRTHLQLADDVGIVVAEVATGSPAEKAGLRRHDILLEVDGEQIFDISVLQQAVARSAGKPVTLKLIRLAKETTLTVQPEERPADLAMTSPAAPTTGDPMMDQLQAMLRGMPQGNLRILGPGMIAGAGPLAMGQLPGGVSANITREGGGPAKITVRRGDQTWTIEEGDEQALAELPEDVRPLVERMLGRQGGMFRWPGNINELLPNNLGEFGGPPAVGELDQAPQRLMERMEELERQLDALRERLHTDPAEPATP
ncbi:MAG TPA: PDZ domain-containing protein [Lacipirellulaceae bacterium]|nr:PDZ domain-containing protein [Lacipirellulaceae bacterium]